MLNAIEKLNLGKTSGRDNITPEMIKNMAGIRDLTEIINKGIRSKKLPGIKGIGIREYYYQFTEKNGDKPVCSNYREITLSE